MQISRQARVQWQSNSAVNKNAANAGVKRRRHGVKCQSKNQIDRLAKSPDG
jgi:hypothetical protein